MSARLLFIATWNFADDHGGLDRSAKQLKAQAFPYDNIDCEPLVQELLNARLLIEYESGGKKYLHIKGFRTHQKVEKPARPRVPLYVPEVKSPRVLPESSPSSSGSSLGSSSLGMEGKVKKKNTDRAAAQPSDEPSEFVEIRKAFPKRAGSHRWHDALGAFRARLSEGTAAQLMLAGVQRYAEFIRTSGKEGTEYVQQAATFLGKNRGFELPWTPPAKPETAGDRLMRTLNGDESEALEHEAEYARLPGH